MMNIIFAYLIIIFTGYFFGTVLYVNILYFTGLEHNIYAYCIFFFFSVVISYKNRVLLMSKMKYKPIKLPSLLKKKKK
jgi:ABC-type multidrug transport system permease subunit